MFPATKIGLVLVGRLFFEPHEIGKAHTIRGEIIGPDNAPLQPDLWLSVTPKQHPLDPRRGNWTTIALNYQAVSFPTPGQYQVRLTSGRDAIGHVTIDVLPPGGPK